MNKPIRRVSVITFCTADIDSEISAWQNLLNFRVSHEGILNKSLCSTWNAAAETGSRWVLLQSPTDAMPLMRFIETGPRPGYLPELSWGWNVTEVLVNDVDALAGQLKGTDFQIIYGPADLTTADKAPRVLQTVGPSGELIYFTRIFPGMSRYGLKAASGFVDRAFNIAVGGPSIDELQIFYGEMLGMDMDGPHQYRGTIAAKAAGADTDGLYPVSVATAHPEYSIIELDEFSATTPPRPRDEGCIPGGMSMVTLEVDNLDAFAVEYRSEPLVIAEPPYNGRRVAVTVGPAGEWLEFVEAS